MTSEAFTALRAHLREIELLDGIAGTLGWDEQTYMPRAAADLRGGQIGLLARLSHERLTDPRVEGWLGKLDAKDAIEGACLRNLGRAYRREKPAAARRYAILGLLAMGIGGALGGHLSYAQGAGMFRWQSPLQIQRQRLDG